MVDRAREVGAAVLRGRGPGWRLGGGGGAVGAQVLAVGGGPGPVREEKADAGGCHRRVWSPSWGDGSSPGLVG